MYKKLQNLQKLRVSIVIPVYNEADHIAACLEAIAAQTVRPYEVIVVDNNSTDQTIAVAQRYANVTIVSENRQGVVYARDRGCNLAGGEIIGRIDADTIISPDWVGSLQRIFQDQSVSLVTGSARYHDTAWAPIFNRADLIFRGYLAAVLGREVAIQGANMGMRRSTWHSISHHLCRQGGMHEDFDIGIHANWQDFKVVYDKDLVVSLCFRQAEARFREFVDYLMLSPQTYARHGLKSRRHMYTFICVAILFYVPITILHRGYDIQQQKFSFAKLMLSPQVVRVNPGTFVD